MHHKRSTNLKYTTGGSDFLFLKTEEQVAANAWVRLHRDLTPEQYSHLLPLVSFLALETLGNGIPDSTTKVLMGQGRRVYAYLL